MFGKSRGVGATGRTRQTTIQSAICRHWNICQLEIFPRSLSIIAKNVPFYPRMGGGQLTAGDRSEEWGGTSLPPIAKKNRWMRVEYHRGHQVATFFRCKDASKNSKFLEKRKESQRYLRCSTPESPSVQTHDLRFGARCPRNRANAVTNVSDAIADLINRILIQLRQQLNIVEDRILRGGQGARGEEKDGKHRSGFPS